MDAVRILACGLIAVFAALSFSPVPPKKEIPIRAASYNIRHGAGFDNKLDLDRTAALLKSFEADFIGLQEVDRLAKRSGSVDQVVELGRQLKMNPAFGSFMDFDGGQYGMGILSKHPIRNTEALRLPEGNEPRVALLVEAELPDGQLVTVVNVHFDWVDDDKFRFAQASLLVDHLRKLKTPFILLGDFNDTPKSRTLGLFHAIAEEVKKPEGASMSFPADKPEIEIDFIFTAPAARWKAKRMKVVEEKVASDHRPLLAELLLISP